MTIKYCVCGQAIEVGSQWNGLVYRLVFRDPETGVEIDHCSGCGESVTAWLYRPPGLETLDLLPDALSDEPPDESPAEEMIITPEQQLKNVATIVQRMATPTRLHNGHGRKPSYQDDKHTIASAALQLAEMVLLYHDGELHAVSTTLPF